MPKTIQEINAKIKKGTAVVVTAEEIIDIVEQKGPRKAAAEVDVVTTGTFGPMCSSSAYLNTGHTKPRIKLGGGTCTLNGVPCYTGIAAVDILLGATAMPDNDLRNTVYPGSFKYGGAHVIEDLVAGKSVTLKASAYGTDCYPRREITTKIRLEDLNEAVLFNPRNAYQNYNVGVNLSGSTIYTYMGTLRPKLGNANYSTSGQLSPLLNDPLYKNIGIGTRIFLGGGIGYVAWNGTQHNPGITRGDNDVPKVPGGTLAVMGDLKAMSPDWLRGASFRGYGVSLTVGIGVPIPVLNEEIVRYTAVKDSDIYAPVVDFSHNVPNAISKPLGEVHYADLKKGSININGKDVPTGGLSSYRKARTIAETLKSWIQDKRFYLSEQVAPLPSVDAGIQCNMLRDRPVQRA